MLTREAGEAPAVAFYRTVEQAVREGSFNEVLWYTLHVPCDIDCRETLDGAMKVKKVLELNDIEAAYHLKEGNMRCMYEFHYYYPHP